MRSTSEILADVLAGRTDVLAALSDAHDAAWEATDSTTLELCRIRVAMLLGNHDEASANPELNLSAELVAAVPAWPSAALLSAAQRACLRFTEEFVIDVASLSDATAGAVVAELGEQGFVDFVNALLVIEQRQRMRLAFQRLLPEFAQ